MMISKQPSERENVKPKGRCVIVDLEFQSRPWGSRLSGSSEAGMLRLLIFPLPPPPLRLVCLLALRWLAVGRTRIRYAERLHARVASSGQVRSIRRPIENGPVFQRQEIGKSNGRYFGQVAEDTFLLFSRSPPLAAQLSGPLG